MRRTLRRHSSRILASLLMSATLAVAAAPSFIEPGLIVQEVGADTPALAASVAEPDPPTVGAGAALAGFCLSGRTPLHLRRCRPDRAPRPAHHPPDPAGAVCVVHRVHLGPSTLRRLPDQGPAGVEARSSAPTPRRGLHARRSAPGSPGHVVGGALPPRRLGGRFVHLLTRPEMDRSTLRWGSKPSARVRFRMASMNAEITDEPPPDAGNCRHQHEFVIRGPCAGQHHPLRRAAAEMGGSPPMPRSPPGRGRRSAGIPSDRRRPDRSPPPGTPAAATSGYG